MGAGRPATAIVLSGEERATLQRWLRRHNTSQQLARRARIVLACAEGDTNAVIAKREGCSPVTVSKWRLRFASERLGGLADLPRSGAPRTMGDDVVEAVVIDALESAPTADTHWSTRGLAAKHGVSRESVRRIWRAFGLKPWEQDEFKISPDPLFVEKVRDIVGLYMSPPVNAVCFAVDEKPQIQALNRTSPILPAMLTVNERATNGYVRNAHP